MRSTFDKEKSEEIYHTIILGQDDYENDRDKPQSYSVHTRLQHECPAYSNTGPQHTQFEQNQGNRQYRSPPRGGNNYSRSNATYHNGPPRRDYRQTRNRRPFHNRYQYQQRASPGPYSNYPPQQQNASQMHLPKDQNQSQVTQPRQVIIPSQNTNRGKTNRLSTSYINAHQTQYMQKLCQIILIETILIPKQLRKLKKLINAPAENSTEIMDTKTTLKVIDLSDLPYDIGRIKLLCRGFSFTPMPGPNEMEITVE